MSRTVFTVQGLVKRYGTREAVRGISATAEFGEFIGLIGANGSGKTSFLKCLCGQIRPNAGTISVDGIDMLREPVRAKQCIGYAIESELLPNKLTGNQVLDFVAGTKSCPVWRDGIAPLAELIEIHERLDDPIETYSQGMRAKIGILAALIGEPKLIVFDESLATLDPVAAYRLKQFLREGVAAERWSVVLSTHAIESVEHVATRVMMLQAGQLAADWTKQELLDLRERTGKTLEEILVERIVRKEN